METLGASGSDEMQIRDPHRVKVPGDNGVDEKAREGVERSSVLQVLSPRPRGPPPLAPFSPEGSECVFYAHL